MQSNRRSGDQPSRPLGEVVELLERALALLRGHAAGSTPAPDSWQLTPRETMVLKLLRAGHSNLEIATALGISIHTTRTHVARVLSKMYVHSRWQLVET